MTGAARLPAFYGGKRRPAEGFRRCVGAQRMILPRGIPAPCACSAHDPPRGIPAPRPRSARDPPRGIMLQSAWAWASAWASAGASAGASARDYAAVCVWGVLSNAFAWTGAAARARLIANSATKRATVRDAFALPLLVANSVVNATSAAGEGRACAFGDTRAPAHVLEPGGGRLRRRGAQDKCAGPALSA